MTAVSRPDHRAEWVGAAIDSGDPGNLFYPENPS
jgi:hypothetical protein